MLGTQRGAGRNGAARPEIRRTPSPPRSDLDPATAAGLGAGLGKGVWPRRGAEPQEGPPYESPQAQANQRAVGRGLDLEAGLALVGADRKFRRGGARVCECDRISVARPVGGAVGLFRGRWGGVAHRRWAWPHRQGGGA